MTASTRSPASWGSKDLAAVQIMSHGSAGSLTLGSATLGQGQLDSYKDQLRAWGDAMAEHGDILLYGCNVAAGKAAWPSWTACPPSRAPTWPRRISAAPRWAATGCWTTVTAPSRPPR